MAGAINNTCKFTGGPPLNTDISGVGVRVSFYLQTIFLAIQAARSATLDEVSAAEYTLLATNVAMAITALILGLKPTPEISFHEHVFRALVVLYLLSLCWTAHYFALASCNNAGGDARWLQRCSVLQSLIVFAFALAILISAPHFGSNPECNKHAVLVFFGHFPVFPAGRIVGGVAGSIVISGYMYTTLKDYLSKARRTIRSRKHEAPIPQEEHEKHEITNAPNLNPKVETAEDHIEPYEQINRMASIFNHLQILLNLGYPQMGGAQYRPNRDGKFILQFVLITILWALAVMNTELLIAWNNFASPDSDVSIWQFGQILPLLLVVSPMVGVVTSFQNGSQAPAIIAIPGSNLNAVTRISTYNNRIIKNGPGMQLSLLLSAGGELVETVLCKWARLFGRGPVFAAKDIESYSGKDVARVAKLDELFSLLGSSPPAPRTSEAKTALRLRKLCGKVLEYTKGSHTPETQTLAFKAIVWVTTRYIGLRAYFLAHLSSPQNARPTKSDIAKLWRKDIEPENQEWNFFLDYAAFCIGGPDQVVPVGVAPKKVVPNKAEREKAAREKAACAQTAREHMELAESIAAVEGRKPSSFGSLDEGLCVSNRLLNCISTASTHTEFDRLVAVRYLAGILELPSFWQHWIQNGLHSLSNDLCKVNIRLLEDLATDCDAAGTRVHASDLMGLDPKGIEMLLLATLTHLPLELLPKDEIQTEESKQIISKLLKRLQTERSKALFPEASKQAERFLADAPQVVVTRDLTNLIKLKENFAPIMRSYMHVYQGELEVESSLTKTVAVKYIIPQGNSNNAWARMDARTRREMFIWKRLAHKNIVSLLGTTTPRASTGIFVQSFMDEEENINSSSGTLWTKEMHFVAHGMVSLWMMNGNLVDFIRDDLELEHRLQIVSIVLSVVDNSIFTKSFTVHSVDVIHGNLTSGNVLIDDDGSARIGGFGHSTIMHEFDDSSSVIGGYLRFRALELMPPLDGDFEHFRPMLTPACDIYSLGSVVLQILTSKLPYHNIIDENMVALVVAQKRHPERPSGAGCEALTDRYWNFIVRCWSFPPMDRPNAEQAHKELMRLRKEALTEY
ncbi:hypothetical protein HWV62_21102 [Athelia sp. TMB]|nr:hypothetical protein HWV62_21102 [Athelia sp. TMB]